MLIKGLLPGGQGGSTSRHCIECCSECRALPLLGGVAVPAGVHPRRHGAAHDVQAALGRRGQAQPAPAVLRGSRSARRPAQPRDERHRQPRAEPPADDQPADDERVHAARDEHHDAAHLADPGHHRARDAAAVDVHHPLHRQTVARPVHRAVGTHRQAQCARRGVADRSRDREVVRTLSTTSKRCSGRPTTISTRPASARSSSPARSSRR